MTPEKVVKNFARCSDWEERYLYLIELGEQLPNFPQEQMTEQFLLPGCQSRVWLVQRYQDDQLNIRATSDAALVKGLLKLVLIAYDGKSKNQVCDFDIEAWFKQLELSSHLSPSRTQGLEAMVRAITAFAVHND